MKHLLTIAAIAGSLVVGSLKSQAQGMAVNSTGSAANSSAMLDVSSTTQGMLVPRMTSVQRTGISSPATGLLVYQTDGTAGFYYYNGTAWTSLNGGGGGSPTGSAGGDLAGTYPNPTIGATASTGDDVIAAINSSSSIINAANMPTTVTTQGNTFNGNSQLVQLSATGKLPAIDGSQLTNLPGGGGTMQFYGTFTSNISLSQSVAGSPAPQTIVWNSALLNAGTAMNTATGTYTVPSDGYYMVDAQAVISGTTGAIFMSIQVGSDMTYFGANGGNTNVFTAGDFAVGSLYATVSHVIYMTAGTQVKIRLGTNTSGGVTVTNGYANGDYLAIYKL